ncbi:MAG: hypothetical protein M3552_20245 [Planctomycetota bacterium]|nr:hypothetical protein [Planctomycetaceae bacterium]MDQ3332949.1 hypothetical protein [Planctomycetota bacterium]
MLLKRFVGEKVELSCGDVLVELPIPTILIAFRNPLRELAEVEGRKLEDFAFELFEGHGLILPLRRRLAENSRLIIPLCGTPRPSGLGVANVRFGVARRSATPFLRQGVPPDRIPKHL